MSVGVAPISVTLVFRTISGGISTIGLHDHGLGKLKQVPKPPKDSVVGFYMSATNTPTIPNGVVEGMQLGLQLVLAFLVGSFNVFTTVVFSAT